MSSTINSPISRSYALLLISAFLWGIAPPIIKHTLNSISLSYFLLFRFAIAGMVTLYYYLFLFNGPKLRLKQLPPLILLGILGIPLCLIPLFLGLTLTSSLEAAIIAASSPLLAVAASSLFLKERINRNEKIGLAIATVATLGVALSPLIIDGHFYPLAIKSLAGNILIILSNIFWVAYLIYAKKIKPDSTHVSLVSYLVSLPIFAVLALINAFPASTPLNLDNLLISVPGILYMAIFGSLISFWARTEGQKAIPASKAAIFTYLEPVFTIPLAFFWLKESVSLFTMLCFVAIIFGVFFSERKPRVL